MVVVTSLIQGRLFADTPLAPPELREIWSRNGQYCAVMDPKPMTTTVYRVEADGKRIKQWTMQGWFRVADLADDGVHFVCGYDGMNLLPLRITADEPMIRFFKKGRLLKTVILSELIKDQGSLERTVSHYYWGRYLGLDEKGRYVVETVEGRKLAFDVTTGKQFSPVVYWQYLFPAVVLLLLAVLWALWRSVRQAKMVPTPKPVGATNS